MKIKISAILISVIILCSFASVMAESTLSVNSAFNADSGEVLITGSGNGEIIITVLGETVQESSLSTDNLPLDMFQFFGSGSFEHSILLPADAAGGKYKVIATAQGERAEDTFIYINEKEAEAVLPEINAAESKEDFAAEVSENAAKLGVDTSDSFYIENSEKIFEILYALGEEFETPSQFYNAYYKCYALCSLNELNTEAKDFSENAEKVLGDYAIYLDISYSDDYQNDMRLSSGAKKELLLLLSAEDYSTVLKDGAVFADYFESAKALASVKAADSWHDIKAAILEDFETLFKDMTEDDKYYSSVRTPQNVFTRMMNYTYDEFDDIETAFSAAAKSVYTAERTQQSSSGSSSSGSSVSGGGSSVITTPANPDNPLWTPESETVDVKKEIVTLQSGLSANFTDIDASHWAYDAVAALSGAGVISGYGDGKFAPSGNITRAEFTKMICTAFGIPQGSSEFADVSGDAWYYKYVGGAADNKIVEGSDGYFRPEDKILRQDAALIIYRALSFHDIALSGAATFADNSDISLYAFPAVGALKSYSVVIGSTGNYFYPKNNITRAEAAQLIYRAVNTAVASQK